MLLASLLAHDHVAHPVFPCLPPLVPPCLPPPVSTHAPHGPCLVQVGIQTVPCAAVMLADTFVDSYVLLIRILRQFFFGRGLYVNELMAKKFSLLGCVALLIASAVQSGERQRSFSGMLMETSTLSTRLSVALLFGRLLIAVLFLYVGLSEV